MGAYRDIVNQGTPADISGCDIEGYEAANTRIVGNRVFHCLKGGGGSPVDLIKQDQMKQLNAELKKHKLYTLDGTLKSAEMDAGQEK